MPDAGRKAVVFGGVGFMGSHTADALTDRGYDVVVFDRVPSPWLGEGQNMVLGDILDREAVRVAVRGATCVYHFAGVADIAEARKRSYETVLVNVIGTTNVLQACVEERVLRFLYASTMYVYSPFGSLYRATKQAAETIIESYHETHGLQYTLLRYGSLYGPRAQAWNGLKKYVTQVVRDRKLRVEGDDQRVREYIHVADAARLSVDVLDASHTNQAVTVTGSQVLTTAQLGQMIFEIAGIGMNLETSSPGTLRVSET